MSNDLKAAWNRRKTASVFLSKIKEIAIYANTYNDKFHVNGWYNKENSFSFGDDFVSLEEAQKFVDDLRNTYNIKSTWNKDKTALVFLSKIKEIVIKPNTHNENYNIRAWYNGENFFLIGSDFATLPEAQRFVENIHRRV
jgi:hypothetical protein